MLQMTIAIRDKSEDTLSWMAIVFEFEDVYVG